MKQRITKNILQQKLNQTSVPDATEGWEAMQSLLDAHTAEKRPGTIFLVIKRSAVAAAILALIGLLLWPSVFNFQPAATVDQKIVRTPNSFPKKILPPATGKASARPQLIAKAEKKPPVAARSLYNATDRPASLPVASNPGYSFTLPALMSPVEITTPNVAALSANTLKLQTPSLPNHNKRIYTAQLLSRRNTDLNNEENDNTENSHPLHISLRLKANGGSSFGKSQQNFNPVLKGTPVDIYPAVYVSKKFSDKVGIQAGLAVVSPVDISNASLNRSIANPGRTAVAMAVETRDNFEISRLYYVDVPVTVQYHLSKRFTVGSGLQLSILEKIIGRRQRVDYNAANQVMYAEPVLPSPVNLTGNQDAEQGINPLDLRWLGTFKYRISERWLTSLQLQYGLLDISDNRAFLQNHRDHNVVVSAGIGFFIK